MLEMLLEFDALCTQHNLAAIGSIAGTLLGAVVMGALSHGHD